MWIEKRDNGKWRFKERYEDPLTGKTKSVSVTLDKNTASTRKQAERALTERINGILGGNVCDNSKLSFSQLIDLWREYQKQTVKQSTYKRNLHSSNRLIEIIGGDVLAEKLNAGYVMKQLMKHDKNPGTVNEHLTRFKSIMRWGYKFDYISDISWLEKMDPMKDEEKSDKLSEKYLESHELKLVLDHMKIDRWISLTKFLALTGMRVGEAFALRIDDIDLANKLIHITRTYDVVNGIFTTPKTKTSIRDIAITNEMLPLCKSLRHGTLEARLTGESNLIFLRNKNDYYAYEKYFKHATKEAIGRQLTVHALRHTHVALLAENGIPLDVISRRLGHSSSKVTREVYFHVTEKLKEKEYEQVRNINLL